MERKEFPSVYPYSLTEAKRLNESDLWNASHADNIACRKAIEAAIMLGYDGMRLSENCAKGVISEFGYHRTAFVLANSLKKKEEDGRVSMGNRNWRKGFFVPNDGGYNAAYAAANDTGVLAEANLPDWARERLEQIQSKEQTANDAPDMDGMTMR